jgi:hypothetical protein
MDSRCVASLSDHQAVRVLQRPRFLEARGTALAFSCKTRIQMPMRSFLRLKKHRQPPAALSARCKKRPPAHELTLPPALTG